MNTLWQLLVSFGQIGIFSLGGGHSMLKLIEDEIVHQRGWLSLDEYATLVGTTFLFPGLTAMKVSGLIGLKVAGVPGLVVSIIGVTLPGVLLAALFYTLIMSHKDHPVIKKLLVLMQYGAVALLAAALFSLAKPLAREFSVQASILAMMLFVGVAVFEGSPFVGLIIFVMVGLLIV
ncbi:MAG: chromate transporter [Alphaproteobacteria bacterium]|nr:chromate transporter [Alphaproteobacteria bacterium]